MQTGIYRVSTADVYYSEGCWQVASEWRALKLLHLDSSSPTDVLTSLYAAELIEDSAILQAFEIEDLGGPIEVDYMVHGQPCPFFELEPVEFC